MSRQFNYPTQPFEALRNSRLDLVSLIPTCHKHILDLHQLTQRGRTGWRERGADRVITERNWVSSQYSLMKIIIHYSFFFLISSYLITNCD